MLLLNIAAEQFHIIIDHFQRGMSQNTSESKWVAAVQNIKLRHRMPERMWRDSDAGNVRHVTIGLHFVLQGSCTDLFVFHVDEQGIRLQVASYVQIFANDFPAGLLERHSACPSAFSLRNSNLQSLNSFGSVTKACFSAHSKRAFFKKKG